MKIYGWMADHSGCGYYRVAMPFDELRARGVDATNSTRMPADIMAGAADVVVGQRVCNPGSSGTWQKMAREGRSKMVFELDDDLWTIEPSNRQAYAFYDETRLGLLEANIRCADAVTVSTDRLAEVVSKFNQNVHVIPNYVRAWMLDWRKPTTELLTVGWGGSPSHIRDFGEMAKPLKAFLQSPSNRATAEFHCIGPDFTKRVASIHGRTRHTGWFPRVEPYLQAMDFDIGVIPLRANVFNDAKSDVKSKEMQALGIPIIASNTGPYKTAIKDGETGLLVSTPREWRDALDLLRNDKDLREQIGAQAREESALNTIETNFHRWIEAYK